MKDLLTIEDLAPYLPYGLEMIFLKSGRIIKVIGVTNVPNKESFYVTDSLYENYDISRWAFRPLLHPMSDLTKPITVPGYNEGKEFVPIDVLWNETLEQLDSDTYHDHFLTPDMKTTWICQENVLLLEWVVVEKLIEWHFDIKNLLARGLAIDINEIKP
jgi:hypothetical protein